MSNDKQNHERIGEQGWDGHARAQLVRMARLPFPEKLGWLEEAHRLVRQLRSAALAKVPAKPKN